MNLENIFNDANSIKIWRNYFKRIDKIISALDTDSREETKFELQDHLYQSFKEETGDNEVSKLLSAMENLGEPEEFLKHTVSEKLIKKGTQTLSPHFLLKGLLYRLSGGIKNLFSGLLFSTGYLLVLIFGLMSLIKFISPEKVGLFVWDDGTWVLGISKFTDGANEMLGYWIVPIALLISFFLYYILTQLLKLTLKKE